MSLKLNSSGGGSVTLNEPVTANNRNVNLPDANTTLVGTDVAQTLTNKTIQGGAITSGTAVASTSGTAIDFTSIPSWVKRITVMFSGVSTNGTSLIQIQIGSGSVDTTSYISNCWTVNTNNASSTTGFAVTGAVAAAAAYNGHATITNVSGFAYIQSSVLGGEGSFSSISGGRKTLSGTLDRIRITTVNGTDTFDAGFINILYEG